MPPVPPLPSTAPSCPAASPNHSYVHTAHLHFLDPKGRVLLLRGVNLSGASKAPVGHLSNKPFIYDDEDDGDQDEDSEDDPYSLHDNCGTSKDKISFVGRPLNLEDGSADVHLARLQAWGFNLLRMPFTWEAIEHQAPGNYDYEFIEYLLRVLDKCREYGFRVYMDPHQDVWSRFSGGSGAPYWTLLACGIHPPNISSTQAAILHSEYPYSHNPAPSSFPAMLWSTNYGRLLSQTIFTLFFAGKEYAPNCVIDGMNIQDWLQEKYLGAVDALAKKIQEWENEDERRKGVIIGWDSINEPSEGLVGWDDLNINPSGQGSTLKKGTHPTPAQSFRLGMGQAQTVDNYKFGTFGSHRDGTVTIDPKGLKLWGSKEELGEDEEGHNRRWGWQRSPEWKVGTCVWALHGVWDIETGFILLPDYFKYRTSSSSQNGFANGSGVGMIEEVDFMTDFWKPHWLEYSKVVREHMPSTIIFVQPPVFALPPRLSYEETHGRCVYSPHYYDGLTLVSRHWGWVNADALGLLRGKYKGQIGGEMMGAVKFGERSVRKSLREQIGYLQDDVSTLGYPTEKGDAQRYGLGKYPTLIGEIGTPFDMDDKKSYGFSRRGRYLGDYSSQEKALDASLNACDGSRAVNWTVWTYVGDDHSHRWGDGWNMEDLSLFSLGDLVERRQPEPRNSSSDSESEIGKSTTTLVLPDASSSFNLLELPKVRSARPGSHSPYVSLHQQTHHPYSNIRGYIPNPYIFLTNGARAYRAFARPWPVKTVGEPEGIEFNVEKGVFRLGVRLSRDDVFALGEKKNGDYDEERATEVYLPLVHYAHQDIVNDAHRIWEEGEREDGVETDTNTVVEVEVGSKTEKEAPCLIGDTYRLVYPSMNGEKCAGQEVALVDVDIRVSDGCFKVVGQRLLWWYDGVVENNRGDVKVQLEVKRRGGPLKVVDWRKVGGLDGESEDEEKGPCEKFCDAFYSCFY